uniref:Cystatin domain-containing protein n=1 Tax=Leersia perrieri TaxID=77586 RepID=A0A0D9VRZ0_9ORYZ
MASRLLLAAIAIVAVYVAAMVPGARAFGIIGGWRRIENISDPHIQELGQWAVMETNKGSPSSPLTFSKVTSAFEPWFRFMKFRHLDIDASRCGVMHIYKAMLIIEHANNTRKLLSFEGDGMMHS